MKTVFKGEMYFPIHIRIVAIAMILVGGVVLVKSLVAGLVICLISVVVASAYYGVEVDLTNRSYREFVWLLGVRKGDAERFENIEYIFIKANRESQTMNSRISSSTITREVFDAYIKFSEEQKVHLIRQADYDAVLKKIRPFATALNARIVDYSSGRPIPS